MDEKHRCNTCRWHKEGPVGECHLLPPVVLPFGFDGNVNEHQTCWPEVHRDDWCAKHEAAQ